MRDRYQIDQLIVGVQSTKPKDQTRQDPTISSAPCRLRKDWFGKRKPLTGFKESLGSEFPRRKKGAVIFLIRPSTQKGPFLKPCSAHYCLLGGKY
jgi:hypothetical protein